MQETVIRRDPSEEELKLDVTGEETYLVFWNEHNILTVGAFTQGESSQARILPGVNKLSARIWGYLERHPIQKMNIEEGSLKLLTKNGNMDWDEFDTIDGVKYVKGISDILELERISRVSKKVQIKIAADDRIEEIMKLIRPKQ